MWPNPQFPEDLVTFTEEIPYGNLHFLCSVSYFLKTCLLTSSVLESLRPSFHFCLQEKHVLRFLPNDTWKLGSSNCLRFWWKAAQYDKFPLWNPPFSLHFYWQFLVSNTGFLLANIRLLKFDTWSKKKWKW